MTSEDDPELQSKLAPLLQEKGDQIGAPWEQTVYTSLIEGLLKVAHYTNAGSAGVAEITTAVNKVLAKRGELLELSPRAMGSLLRQRGFWTRRLGAGGRGIMLVNAVREQIHHLAEDGGLLGRFLTVGCPQCDERIRQAECSSDEQEFAREVETRKLEDDQREGDT